MESYSEEAANQYTKSALQFYILAKDNLKSAVLKISL